MDKATVVHDILKNRSSVPQNTSGSFFAPSNIALCKYWGKRNTVINLPVTASLSISLGDFGAHTTVSLLDNATSDNIIVNAKINADFISHVTTYLNLFRPTPTTYFCVETTVNIPIGAGLASSACGYAALIGALDQLYGWQLSTGELSILARLGSGSASRSFWQGFVEWQVGIADDGSDSFGVPLRERWPDLRIGLLILNTNQKSVSSRKAMEATKLTSPFYAAWPEKHAADLLRLKKAITQYDFVRLGETSESNALAMHALMVTAWPPILYTEPKTVSAMQDVWQARQAGIDVYFTQDAGPNLKLLFLEKDMTAVKERFPDLIIVAPFKEAKHL